MDNDIYILWAIAYACACSGRFDFQGSYIGASKASWDRQMARLVEVNLV